MFHLKHLFLVIIFLLCANVADALLTNGLVSYWKLYTNSQDSMGLNHLAASSSNLKAIQNSTCINSGCYNFNGTVVSYKLYNDTGRGIVTGGGNRTLCTWSMTTIATADYDYIVTIGGTETGPVDPWTTIAYFPSRKPGWVAKTNNVPTYLTTNQNAWAYICVMYNNVTGNRSLWINGTNTNSTIFIVSSLGDNIRIGASSVDADAEGMVGYISDTAYWNRTLTNTEHALLYTLKGNPLLESTCNCPSVHTNWIINFADACVIQTSCNIGIGNMTFYGTGNFTINATIVTNKLTFNVSNINNTIYINNNGILYINISTGTTGDYMIGGDLPPEEFNIIPDNSNDTI